MNLENESISCQFVPKDTKRITSFTFRLTRKKDVCELMVFIFVPSVGLFLW